MIKQVEQSTFQPHPDYESNIRWAREWIKENEPHHPKGVRVLIGSGEGGEMKDAFVIFLYTPPKERYGSGFAHHVTVHQDSMAFYPKVHGAYQTYKGFVDEDYYNTYIRRRVSYDQDLKV